ncbi:sodium-dependent nutrient amino acid transporter 1 isoform X2 [Uranotaenia lowii]|uniref:sodium-dependent nutrient amino acid transporter 1 isoform X2 n=1 Tax=Uranotaenia lowii TaxID=190385 RepID=UPI0024798F1B|nr:sodium-dependent nutrient amino acid transporter 1 isoform X2 [Uranotaenia lowii]
MAEKENGNKKDFTPEVTQNGIVEPTGKDTPIMPNIQTKDIEGGATGAADSRPEWSNKYEFLFSCIAMSVGLGNVWRFPFTAYANGGGAFLIPYLVVLFVIGRPLYYLEMIMGQFTSRSSVKIWHICPLFRGIGIGQLVGTTSVVSYYVSLIALTLAYIFASFASELPWAKCQESWGTNCISSEITVRSGIKSDTLQNVSSSQIYFLDVVLKEKDQIDDGLGTPDWKLALWLLLAWVIIFLVMVRGVKSSGKVAYFLALFPYVVLITILIRALTLDGAWDGVIFFLKPQWSELLNPTVWREAVVQCFFSLAAGMGPVIMLASYNNFLHNCHRDAMIVTTIDTFTSLLGGMTIFSILGNLAHNLGIDDISKVVKSGTGLAFISYPDAIAKFDVVPQLFSVLFFFMMCVLGIGSAVALFGAISTAVMDSTTKFKFWQVALALAIVGYCAGLVYITPGGQWILDLVDHYGGTFLIFILAIVEIMVIFWLYGLENFCRDVEFMTQRRVGIYWRLCWGLITPVFMLAVFIYSLIEYEWPTYSGKSYPSDALICGVALMVFGVLQILTWSIWLLSQDSSNLSLWTKIKNAAKPNSEWGPASETSRKAWMKYKEESKTRQEEEANAKGHSSVLRRLNVLFGRYNDFIPTDDHYIRT